MLLAEILWNPDPIAFTLGPLTMRWYGLLFAGGFGVGYFILHHFFKREHKPEKDVDVLVFTVLLATILGARLGHCFFYEPARYLANPIEILQIWKGGMASHGATIGIILALLFYARRHTDQPFLWLGDRLVIPIALGAAFVRIANFINSEIYGYPTDLPWGVVFIKDFGPEGAARHPSQAYEALAYLLLFGLLWWLYENRRHLLRRGQMLGFFMIGLFGARFLIEFTKTPQEAYGFFIEHFGITTGQVLSIPLVAFGIWLLARKDAAPMVRPEDVTK